VCVWVCVCVGVGVGARARTRARYFIRHINKETRDATSLGISFN